MTAGLLKSLSDASGPDGKIDWVKGVSASGIAEKIPELLADVNFEIDRLTDDLVAGCIRAYVGTVELTDVSALEMLEMRNLILASTELPELFEAEKNCYRGVLKSVLNLLDLTGTQPTTTNSEAGGPELNTQSVGATTGPSAN